MKTLSLNVKMSFVLALLTVTCAVIAWLGLSTMAGIESSLERIATHDAVRMKDSGTLQATIRLLVAEEKDILIEDSKDGRQSIARLMDESIAEFEKSQNELLATTSDEGRVILIKIGESFAQWKTNTLDIRRLALSGKIDEAASYSRGRGSEFRKNAETHIQNYVDYNSKRMQIATAQAEADYVQARNRVIGTSLVLILASLMIAAFVLRAVSKAINRIISELSNNSTQVAAASRQIAAASEELSQSSIEQASSIEETAAAVEELTSMVKRNAESANSSAELAQSATSNAHRGKKVIDEMKQAMTDINEGNDAIANQIAASNARISEIVKVISDIGNKTKVINDIVFQTKLLSFNASVEAARAGEHGKGFAVVAEEVGNLAQMSGNAAKEISSMLDSSVLKVEAIVEETKTKVTRLIEDGKGRTAVGSRVAATCGDVLDEIVQSIAHLAEASRGIAVASEEQARGVSEISRAVTQLDQVTQQNASSSEEAASAAEELAAQADGLQSVTRVLAVTIQGGDDVRNTLPASSPARLDNVNQRAANIRGTVGKVVELKTRAVRPVAVTRPAVSGNTAHNLMTIPDEDDPRFKEF